MLLEINILILKTRYSNLLFFNQEPHVSTKIQAFLKINVNSFLDRANFVEYRIELDWDDLNIL